VQPDLPAAANEAALAFIDAWPAWSGPALVIHGPEGSGKSHLAAIWSQESGARFVAARALETGRLPAALATGALVVEDLAAGQFEERAMFHLLNLAREQRAFVLITTRDNPAAWPVGIADLGSRLRALPSLALAAPDDALLRSVIVKLFADRKIAVEPDLVAFLAARIERSFAGARRAVEWLDREALSRKRPVNRSLAGELFREP
jgi:chromosomal replication initiation ATPase DnaA